MSDCTEIPYQPIESAGKLKWIFIPGNVPSLKNSKRIIKCGGMSRLVPSKAHEDYVKAVEWELKAKGLAFRRMAQGLPKPLYVLLRFIRNSRHKFDFTNATDTVQDLIVNAGWIDDDNVTEMIPFYAGYAYDKENPGVYISILTKDTNYKEMLFD